MEAPPAPGEPGAALATRLREELESGIQGAEGDRAKERDFLDAFIRRVEAKEDALVAALREAAPLLRDASHGSAGGVDAKAVIALASRYAYHTHGPSGWRPGLPMGPGFRPPAPQDVHMRMSSLFAGGGAALLPGGGAGVGGAGAAASSDATASTEQKEALQVRSLKMPSEDILGTTWTGKVDFGLNALGGEGGSDGGGGGGSRGEQATQQATKANADTAMDVDQIGNGNEDGGGGGGGDDDLPAMPEGWKPGDAIPDSLLEAVGGELPAMPEGWQPGDPIPGL